MREFETWLTPSEAGDVIGMSRQAVHKRLLAGGTFRAVRTHFGWLLDPKSVEDFKRERAGRFVWSEGDMAIKREE